MLSEGSRQGTSAMADSWWSLPAPGGQTLRMAPTWQECRYVLCMAEIKIN